MAKRYRDGITGQFVSRLTAKIRPAETVGETVSAPLVVTVMPDVLTDAMIEAAAKEYYADALDNYGHPWDSIDWIGKERFRRCARRALQAALAAREAA